MQVKIQITDDGSTTLFLPEMDETYHSKFGAITESKHVFIEAGYKQIEQKQINILEVGMGTGLNVWLTYQQHLIDHKVIHFETIEKYPLIFEVYNALNYVKTDDEKRIFNKIHSSKWNEITQLSQNFFLLKHHVDLLEFSSKKQFDLIYFDAFDPAKQPELWTKEVFEKMYNLLKDNGVLVTYSAKGIVRRAMQSVGFTVARIPGPPGKREMMRALKESQK